MQILNGLWQKIEKIINVFLRILLAKTKADGADSNTDANTDANTDSECDERDFLAGYPFDRRDYA